MSCACNNSYYNLPCCCPTGEQTTYTTTQCANGEPCEEAYSSDCIIYSGTSSSGSGSSGSGSGSTSGSGSGSTAACYGITPGTSMTQIIQLLISQLPQCTTTTTIAPTTSTTTIAPNYCFAVTNTSGSVQVLNVITTNGVNSLVNVNPGQVLNACFRSVITAPGGPLVIVNNGICGPFCPPTTTTTTAAPQPGYCFKITNTSLTVNTSVNYINSFGIPSIVNVGANSTSYTCGLSVSPYSNIVTTNYGFCANGCNSQITTTTTTSTPCLSYTITRTGGTQISFSYIGCDGITYVVTNTTNTTTVVCALQGSINITSGTATFAAGILCSLTTSTTTAYVPTTSTTAGPTTSTSSTSSTSTTTAAPTTTTTLASFCFGIANSTLISIEVNYYNANGVLQSIVVPPSSNTIRICASSVVPSSGITISNLGNCGSAACQATTTTSTSTTSTSTTSTTTAAPTTTTTTLVTSCYRFVNSSTTLGVSMQYYNANGILQTVIVPASGTIYVCASSIGSIPAEITVTNTGSCAYGSFCNPITTTTTQAPTFKVKTNYASTNKINSVSPSFYNISSGSFPVNSGQTLNGFVTAGGTSITVNYTSTVGPVTQILIIKNNIVVGNDTGIPNGTNLNYTYTIPWSITDTIEIQLNNY
jgi:hypothetical protein